MTEAQRHALIGLILTLLFTALFWSTDWDLRLQALAYNSGATHWPYNDSQPWALLYHWGTLPGLLLALAAALGWGLSYASPERAHWRYPCLYLVVLLALGPGFLINVLGKGLMGRPRPDEVIPFGGTWEYLRPFQMGIPGKGRSFLCGHCSMGFLFFGAFYVLRGGRRWAAFSLALLLGLGLGVARVCQGAHFPSDVLLCGSLTFTLAAAFSPMTRRVPEAGGQSWGKTKTWTVTGGLALAVITGFLFSTPIYEEQLHLWYEGNPLPAPRAAIERVQAWPHSCSQVSVELGRGSLDFVVKPQNAVLSLHSLVTGFGFPTAKSRIQIEVAGATSVAFTQSLRGLFVESHGRFECSVAPRHALDLSIRDLDPEARVRLDFSRTSQPVEIEGLTPDQTLPPGFAAKGSGTAIRAGQGPWLRLQVHAAGVELH